MIGWSNNDRSGWLAGWLNSLKLCMYCTIHVVRRFVSSSHEQILNFGISLIVFVWCSLSSCFPLRSNGAAHVNFSASLGYEITPPLALALEAPSGRAWTRRRRSPRLQPLVLSRSRCALVQQEVARTSISLVNVDPRAPVPCMHESYPLRARCCTRRDARLFDPCRGSYVSRPALVQAEAVRLRPRRPSTVRVRARDSIARTSTE
jgi:hypothetical protein